MRHIIGALPPGYEIVDKPPKQELSALRKREVARNVLLLVAASFAAAGIGGAMIWKEHRIGGFLLGGLLVGPAVGLSAGALYAASVASKMEMTS